jgi:tRNA pseudouridine38-40 synthase
MDVRYRATLAYDGSAYCGFQRQAGDLPTIQAAVETALAKISGQQVTVIGAGRTDTGVHAEGQVIAFEVDWRHGDEALLRALNAVLPDDIALQEIRQQAGFHPRFDAVARVYRYTIVQATQRQPLLQDRAWHVQRPLDRVGMAEAAAFLIGVHDFGAFGKPPQGTNTFREVFRSEWAQANEHNGVLHTYHIEANAFLQHMVRRIVGVLVEVGRGALSVDDFCNVLGSGRLVDGVTLAPPHGLVLETVRYPTDEVLKGKRGRRPLEDTEDE